MSILTKVLFSAALLTAVTACTTPQAGVTPYAGSGAPHVLDNGGGIPGGHYKVAPAPTATP